MFGTRVNLTDDKDSTITLFQYDACEQIKSDLEDGMSVFIEGNTAFSSYTKDGEKKSYKNLAITKIYKQKSPIDFDDAKFSEENRFQQEFIFMSVEQEIDFDTNKPTGRAIVCGKIVTNDTVEDTQFILEDKTLISNFRSRLKPYYALKAVGRLITKVEEETPIATDSDDWGSDEGFDDQQHTVKFKEWVITKVYGESIDKDTYSEAVLASITQAEEDFGTFASEEDEDDVWGE
jgi:single-stranded DNA-binding protein